MPKNTRHAVALALVLSLALAPVAAPTAATAGGETAAIPDDVGPSASGNALLSQQHAQQSDAPRLRLGSATVNPNDTSVIRLSTDADNVAGYQTNVTFDPSVVRIEGVVGSEEFGDPVANVNNDAGWVSFTQSGAEGVDEPVLARLRVTAVGEDGDATDLSFVAADTAVNDADRASVDVALVGGQIDVATGDVVAAGDGRPDASGDGSDGGGGGLLDNAGLVLVAGGAAVLGGTAALGGVVLGKRL